MFHTLTLRVLCADVFTYMKAAEDINEPQDMLFTVFIKDHTKVVKVCLPLPMNFHRFAWSQR